MSADNGVYILKTKDQYRVTDAHAIENLYWSFIDFDMKDEYVPTRLVEYFGHTRYTRDFEKAMKVANAIARSLPILEYGIQILPVNKTWKQIVKEAKELAVQELEVLKNENAESNKWSYDIRQLEKIISL